MEDGRSAVSAPPGTEGAVGEIVRAAPHTLEQFDEQIIARVRAVIDDALTGAGLKPVRRVHADVCFACNQRLLRRHTRDDCKRLLDDSIPFAEGIGPYDRFAWFPDGIFYGVVDDGVIASYALAHRSGVMEDQVADLGVETAPAYRRRGCAKTVVSAVVKHITRKGGEAHYYCRPDNAGSIATARSVGFVRHGRSLVFSAPWEP